MGQGLALRGKESSVERAMHHIGRQCNEVYHMFSIGLTLLAASVILFLLASFSLFITIPTTCAAALVFRKQRMSTQSLVKAFELKPDELVNSAFTDLPTIRKQIATERFDRRKNSPLRRLARRMSAQTNL
eukprot:4239588-Prymnesium_polylepis.1